MRKFVDFVKTTGARFSGDNPITWGQYWKLCGGIIGFYALVAAIIWIYYKVSDWLGRRKMERVAKQEVSAF